MILFSKGIFLQKIILAIEIDINNTGFQISFLKITAQMSILFCALCTIRRIYHQNKINNGLYYDEKLVILQIYTYVSTRLVIPVHLEVIL